MIAPNQPRTTTGVCGKVLLVHEGYHAGRGTRRAFQARIRGLRVRLLHKHRLSSTPIRPFFSPTAPSEATTSTASPMSESETATHFRCLSRLLVLLATLTSPSHDNISSAHWRHHLAPVIGLLYHHDPFILLDSGSEACGASDVPASTYRGPS